MHAALDDLPPEILHLVIASTLPSEPVPSNILRVNRCFHTAGVAWLYRDLRFRSQEQLALFAQTSAGAGVALRSVTVNLAGKRATADVWRHLGDALARCRQMSGTGQGPVLMEMLCLRLHSYSRDCSHHLFEGALSSAKCVRALCPR